MWVREDPSETLEIFSGDKVCPKKGRKDWQGSALAVEPTGPQSHVVPIPCDCVVCDLLSLGRHYLSCMPCLPLLTTCVLEVPRCACTYLRAEVDMYQVECSRMMSSVRYGT